MKQKKLYLLISLLGVYSLSSNFSLADTINSYQGSGNDSPIKSGDEIIINNEGNILYGIDSTGGQFNLEKNSISIDTSIFKEEQPISSISAIKKSDPKTPLQINAEQLDINIHLSGQEYPSLLRLGNLTGIDINSSSPDTINLGDASKINLSLDNPNGTFSHVYGIKRSSSSSSLTLQANALEIDINRQSNAYSPTVHGLNRPDFYRQFIASEK